MKEIGPFHKSFSSVVGPNGSGKSNVIDAMLFVFGKKSAKLRMSKARARRDERAAAARHRLQLAAAADAAAADAAACCNCQLARWRCCALRPSR